MRYLDVNFAKRRARFPIAALAQSAWGTDLLVVAIVLLLALGSHIYTTTRINDINTAILQAQATLNADQGKLTYYKAEEATYKDKIDALQATYLARQGPGIIARRVAAWLTRYPANTTISTITFSDPESEPGVTGSTKSKLSAIQAYTVIATSQTISLSHVADDRISYTFGAAPTPTPAPTIPPPAGATVTAPSASAVPQGSPNP